MSYAIVKSITEKDNEIWINSTDNNVYPHHYSDWECHSLTKILQEQGKQAVEIEILATYEEGNFQAGGKNKFTRALTVLRHFPEYKDFDWRCDGKLRKNKTAYDALLLRALNTHLPKEKYIVRKVINGQEQYFHKMTKHWAKWTIDKTRAKIFRYKEDADILYTYFENANNWETIAL